MKSGGVSKEGKGKMSVVSLCCRDGWLTLTTDIPPHRVMHSVIRYRENHIARPRKYNTACHMHPFFVRENPYKQKTESRNTINDLHGFASMQCYIQKKIIKNIKKKAGDLLAVWVGKRDMSQESPRKRLVISDFPDFPTLDNHLLEKNVQNIPTQRQMGMCSYSFHFQEIRRLDLQTFFKYFINLVWR